MADLPQVMEQMPSTGGVNKPTSGTYGEKVAVERLKAALPDTGQPPAVPTAPPAQGPGSSPVPTAPSGLPPGLTAPSRYPDIPASTPLTEAADPLAGSSPGEQRVMLLDHLAKRGTSAETREWAQMQLERIVALGRR